MSNEAKARIKINGLLKEETLALLRELQFQTGEELSALLPSVLDKTFKAEL